LGAKEVAMKARILLVLGVAQLVAVLGLALTASLPAAAQYPAKPVKIVIGSVAGGASDVAARIVAQSMAKSLGQPVIVENRPGANGLIAAQAVFSAPADGHTLLWAFASMSAFPFLFKSSPFESLNEMTPISTTCRLPFGMYIHPGVPAANMPEFIAYARANPGKLTYATGPLSEFMAATQFMRATGTQMIRVPYKGGAQAITDLVAGNVQVYFTPMSQGLPFARESRLRMLATMLPERTPLAPEVPTMKEAGLASVGFPTWNALVGPPRMPRDVADRLSREVRKALQDKEVRAALAAQYLEPLASNPEELAAAIAEYTELWRTFVKEHDIPKE